MAYNIALIPGDGIGREVIPEGVKALESLSKLYNFDLTFTEFPFSCTYYLEHGEMMPEDGIEQLAPF
ncbi:MAG: isocitrate/isopropylmalate family dehydrogenase, partial [Desulfocapsaceae bacterium]